VLWTGFHAAIAGVDTAIRKYVCATFSLVLRFLRAPYASFCSQPYLIRLSSMSVPKQYAHILERGDMC
jgi:hypothetical protein